jgi:hypothetical protein
VRFKPAALLLALHLVAGTATATRAEADPSAEAAFAAGQALVQANCGECIGASAAALARGLREIERALELGYPQLGGAYRLLAEGYGTLAFALAEPGSAEHHRARAAQREIYRLWVQAEPANAEALYGHAVTLDDDPAARRAALERLAEVDPQHLSGQVLLGETEIASGAAPAGLARMKAAFDIAQGAARREFGERLVDAYERQGLPAEAQQVRDQLAAMSFGP